MASPATIKLFLVSGQPDGLRTAEISNWTGLAIAGPRSDLAKLRARKELEAPGVYFLIGKDEEQDRTLIYIGEAENVSKRLGSQSHSNKEFWINAIAFVSKDSNLTKSHIKYLEGQIINKAKELDLLVHNEQASGSSLPESDEADMQHFLKKMYQLLPVLGLGIFETPEKISARSDKWLYCTIKGLKAKGIRTPNGFLVAKGSQTVKAHRASAKHVARKREFLLNEGILKDCGTHYEFIKTIEFSSPSAAASVIRGGASNGLKAWKNKSGKSLKEIEAL